LRLAAAHVDRWPARNNCYHLLTTNYQTEEEFPTMPAPTNTVRLHRVLRAPPERVYKAFLDADAMVKWLPPHGFTGKVHSMDARVGGGYKMSFTNFGTGKSHSFSVKYVELKPYELMRYTDRFDDPNLPGDMQVTVTLRKVTSGTDVSIVEPEIPDGA
jgi:uncharacterized protein YndB with AHSA1/START domain